MAPTQPINDTLVQDSIVKAVQSVSRTMMRRESSLLEAKVGDAHTNTLMSIGPAPYVIGNVGFVGDANGIVYLCFNDAFARHAACQILGMTPAEVAMEGDDVVKDVIGEITNMTTGAFKNALCDFGFPCKLSLPTIVRAEHLSIAAVKAAHRGIYHFSCGADFLIADVQVKI
jgi:chemotaxis protein CheX